MGTGKRKIVLCDTIHHTTPILKEWATGFAEMIDWDVAYLPVPEYSILQIQESVDVLVYAGIGISQIEDFKIFKQNNPNTIIVGAADHWKPEYTLLQGIVNFFIGAIDLFPSVKAEYKINGFDYYTIALAANSGLFYKQENTDKIYDACFIGNLSHGYRYEDKYLYPILDNPKYNCFLGGMTYGKYQQGFIPYQAANTVRNQTKINLNFHVPYQHEGLGEFPDRIDCNQSVFNIALSGNFQLCDHKLAGEYFEGNVVIADESNWLEIFEYYLNHEKEREEKAYNAMLIAQNHHTWLARMKSFIKILETYEK
jgi:hypothetical protein